MLFRRSKQRGSGPIEEGASGSIDSPGRDLGRAIADGVVIGVTVAKESMDALPIVKGVLGGVSEILNLCQVSSE